MADFYKVLIKINLAADQAGIPTFMSTHPDQGDRYNAVVGNSAPAQILSAGILSIDELMILIRL